MQERGEPVANEHGDFNFAAFTGFYGTKEPSPATTDTLA